jgi:hypothetical protein
MFRQFSLGGFRYEVQRGFKVGQTIKKPDHIWTGLVCMFSLVAEALRLTADKTLPEAKTPPAPRGGSD